MIKVGSINGACAVGGRNGVGVGAGEQAERETRMKSTANNCRLGKIRRVERSRSVVIKKKGDPLPGRPTGFLCFFVGGNCTSVFDANFQWQGDLAAEGFLTDDAVDLVHQSGF